MRVSRFRLAAFATATLVFGTTLAGPLVLEPQAHLVPPIEKYQSNSRAVAIDNDRAIVASARFVEENVYELGAFIFERNAAGDWLPTSPLILDEAFSYQRDLVLVLPFRGIS